MEFRIRARVASVTVAVVVMVLSVQADAHPRKQRLPSDYAAWSKVAVCESGGWRVLGYAYPDALGITSANYTAFGGRLFKLGAVPLSQRIAEIRVADRLIRHYGLPIPDHFGCTAW